MPTSPRKDSCVSDILCVTIVCANRKKTEEYMEKKIETQTASREQLVDRIEELERLTEQLLLEKEQEVGLKFPWTGNLGQWYWDVETNRVTCNPMKVMALGYGRDDVPEEIPYSFFTDKIHPDDFEKTMENMRNHLYGEHPVYEVEYRIRTTKGKWKWFYDRGKVTKRSPEGKPLFLAGIVFDITSQKEIELDLSKKNLELEEISRHDGLTGLLNHRAFIDMLGDRIRQSDGESIAVAIFNIDDFKKVNDDYGHVAGDAVLQRVADLLARSVRKTDLAGRYGGEEFVAAFCDTPGTGALSAAEKFRRQVESCIFELGIRITVSGGVCEYMGQSMMELMREADQKMYEAKRRGKNRIVF